MPTTKKLNVLMQDNVHLHLLLMNVMIVRMVWKLLLTVVMIRVAVVGKSQKTMMIMMRKENMNDDRDKVSDGFSSKYHGTIE